WLSVCLGIHTDICSSKNRTTVQYLKVLDCQNRTLVSADSLPHITHSYMWGANERPPLYTEQLGHDLPPTIEDSIAVTLKLGYRYLWIDRYCVNQQNKEQAMSQIQQMDSIYKDSEVTIVAAAGIGPVYGLPSVSRPRRPQSVVNLGHFQLISPGSIATEVLKDSRWSTRGWTFQEAYLSKRRIIFTDEQVYYECSGM
ncbi:HET-domain-containing protein, partial [Acephala macrosclerotiorum]